MRRGMWALLGASALLLSGCGGNPTATPQGEPSAAETTAADTCAPIFEQAADIAVDMGAKGLQGKIRDLNTLADDAAAECPLDQANDLEAAVEAVETTHADLSNCAVDTTCDIKERADAYGEAVEQLRRSVA